MPFLWWLKFYRDVSHRIKMHNKSSGRMVLVSLIAFLQYGISYSIEVYFSNGIIRKTFIVRNWLLAPSNFVLLEMQFSNNNFVLQHARSRAFDWIRLLPYDILLQYGIY